jgi:hypothetical protein
MAISRPAAAEWRCLVLAAVFLAGACLSAFAQDRMPMIPDDKLTAAQ